MLSSQKCNVTNHGFALKPMKLLESVEPRLKNSTIIHGVCYYRVRMGR